MKRFFDVLAVEQPKTFGMILIRIIPPARKPNSASWAMR